MSDQHWYYEVDGRRVGPFEPQEMRRIVQSGMVGAETAVIAPDGQRGRASQLIVRHKSAPQSMDRVRAAASALIPTPPALPPAPPPPPIAPPDTPPSASGRRPRNSYHRTALPLMWAALALTSFSLYGQIQAGTAGAEIAMFVLMIAAPIVVSLVALHLPKPPMPLIVVSVLSSLTVIGLGGLFLSQLAFRWAGVEPIMTTTFALVFICAGLCGSLAFIKPGLPRLQGQEVDG